MPPRAKPRKKSASSMAVGNFGSLWSTISSSKPAGNMPRAISRMGSGILGDITILWDTIGSLLSPRSSGVALPHGAEDGVRHHVAQRLHGAAGNHEHPGIAHHALQGHVARVAGGPENL